MSIAAKLTHKEALSGNVLIVRFETQEEYSFGPGQWCFLSLPDRGLDDERGLRRHLSICNSPGEDGLWFATKVSESAFKKTLARLEIGQEIQIDDPKGRLQLAEAVDTAICFLAGGIGITPFRSLAFHSSLANTGHNITLMYSTRTPEETPFLEDFEKLDKDSDKFRFVATMTRMHLSERTWTGREGRMNAQMIQEEFPAWKEGIFYVAGPPKMAEMMLEMLAELNVPKERMHIEKFMGY